jgi:hypothetical protein
MTRTVTIATLAVLSLASSASAAEVGPAPVGRYQIIPGPPVTGGTNYMVFDTTTGELWQWSIVYAIPSGKTTNPEGIFWRYMGKPKTGTDPGQFVEYDPETAKYMATKGWTPPK